MRRGEIRWYTFSPPDKRRPVVILTRDSAIPFLSGITIAPITSTIRQIPSEVLLTPEEDGVLTASVVNLDNMQTVAKARIGPLLTKLAPERITDIENALCFALGIDQLLHT